MITGCFRFIAVSGSANADSGTCLRCPRLRGGDASASSLLSLGVNISFTCKTMDRETCCQLVFALDEEQVEVATKESTILAVVLGKVKSSSQYSMLSLILYVITHYAMLIETGNDVQTQ